MSAAPASDIGSPSNDPSSECRTEIQVQGMHWAGVRAVKTAEGDAGKQTRDSEDPDKISPPNMIINGTAVFVKDRFRKDRWSLHEDSCFSGKGRGIEIRPATKGNSYVSFTPAFNGGKVEFAEEDETEWEEKPSIHFAPMPNRSEEQALVLEDLFGNGHGHGTVVGRDEKGHLLDETDETDETVEVEAEAWDNEILFV
jgi:hypothetical protein